jgi:hypothetical protein
MPREEAELMLTTALGESIPIWEEALIELTLGRGLMSIWTFFAEIADKFFLGLDFLHTYDASVALEPHTLRIGKEKLLISRSRSMS